ncbi:MAG: molybdopterin-dependent oxidoreductase, partial [Dehalococcoidia bacterium]|nr:molybdopterin-dependent oxidoreductase [Dehalococcoidia bacterium]
KNPENPVQQYIYRLLVPEGILTPPIKWTGAGVECAWWGTDYQFKKYIYPESDQAEVRMLYRYGGSHFSTLPEGSRWAKMYKSPKLEFVLCQTPWMEPESKFADILLPACTLFERNDISEWSAAPNIVWGCNYRIIVYNQKCIEPLYESKPDFEILTLLADKLGFKNEYTEGNTEDDWIRKTYEISSMPQHMSYEKFKEKGYFVVPMPNDYKPKTAFRRFYQTGEGLDTPSGKIEFLSQRLQKYLPDDKERPPVPHYVPSWEGHTTSSLVHKYPLQLMVPHARYTFHTQGDQEGSWIRDIWMHRVLKNGYSYWPIQIHPIDARARGINKGDIVKVYNDRATVLLIARVTEMIRPGTVLARTGGQYDPVEPGNPNSLDKGGAVNLLISSRFMSPNVSAQVNQCLVQVEKWQG